jgi:hypothetical protein
MNIDERLDRLTDRHEALTQTVELLAVDIRDLTADVRNVVAAQRENEKQIGELATFIRQLSEIALRHDNRLDR